MTGTIETAVTDVTVPGAWSYETVVEPSTITAGGGVAATTTLRAKFQADQGKPFIAVGPGYHGRQALCPVVQHPATAYRLGNG